MRNLLITTVLALVGMFNAAAMNNDGHVLTDLWQKYDDARKADRPQQEAEILADIRQKALKRHLPVDFYDAATEYVGTVQRRDWKQRDKLYEELETYVKRFDEPLVTFLWMRQWTGSSSDELWAYVKDHLKGFQGHNPALYRGVDNYLSGALKPFIRSDKEFVLWNLLQSRYYADAPRDEIYQELKSELAGSYPGDGALEYYILSRKSYVISDWPKKRAALKALQEQYSGKALALFPEAYLLLLDKQELDLNKARQQQYKALDVTAQRFETRRKAFRGDEATLAKACTDVVCLLEELEREELNVRVDTTRIDVLFKNLYHANLTLREGEKTIKSWKVANLDRSFYVNDTVSVDLPPLPDGYYTIEAVSGKHTAQNTYTKYTLSLAVRQDAQGRSVYVADYQTGEPLPTATFRLVKGDKEVAVTDLRMNGFTRLPDAFIKKVTEDSRSYYSIQAVSGERRSSSLSLGRIYGSDRVDTGTRCNIYLDRGAYNPGDTVKFKAVLYQGDPSMSLKVCKGKKVEVVLEDSEDDEVAQLDLTTNDWGSVSGQFVIPKGVRGGMFTLHVGDLEANDYQSASFRVDEFVLPTFDLTFDNLKELYLPGSEVPVSGTVRSYSGHSLAGARVSVQVEYYNKVVLEEEKDLDASGVFSFRFPAHEAGQYGATVKIKDNTGETLEFSNYYFISSDLWLGVDVLNKVEANVVRSDVKVVDSRQLSLYFRVRSGDVAEVPLPVLYRLYKADKSLVTEGTAKPGETVKLTVPRSGLYTLKAEASATRADGSVVKEDRQVEILCLLPEDKSLPESVKGLFLLGKTVLNASEGIDARIGTGKGRVYAVATLFGDKRTVLDSRLITVEGGTVDHLRMPYLDSYPDVVRLVVFYFKDGEQVRYDEDYRRAKDKYTLPLSFTRFRDKAYPGTLYNFTVKTEPGAEALVAAWDKSLETIRPNRWNLVNMREQGVDYVPVSAACGVVGARYYPDRMMAAATKSTRVLSDAIAVVENDLRLDDELLSENVVMAYGVSVEEAAPDAGVTARTDFSSALTFQPHLYSKADGTLEFRFRTSDKLSTYIVRVYAHDKQMHNALCEKEMVVSLPVKVSLVEPRYLYEGDVYEAAVTVSSMADEPVSGVIVLRAGDSVQQLPVTLAPNATETRRFHVVVPEIPGQARNEEDAPTTLIPGDSSLIPGLTRDLLLKASFVASDFSDAVQVSVPVYPAAQRLTEAHSAVLRDAMSRDALLADLRSRFVNVPASEAALKEISVLDMVKDAIPSHVEPRGNDVLSLSEAWYIRLMASQIPGQARDEESVTRDLLERILACRNGDGGFSWFEGMPSSAIITAVLLERFALLRDRGFDIPDMTETVKFLDRKQFGTSFPLWCGWVSDAQYMRVRALYPEVPFEVKPVSATDKKRLAQFKKDAKAYLTPSKKDGRGLEGQILAKARRLLTLRSLAASSEGRALAKAWGIGLNSKLEKSIRADVTSLLEYAVEHRDGGWYYPNAVMPYRGLLESEAYAHALLCQLLDSSVIPGPDRESPAVIADGIRLWLMLQKETQHWDTEPAFIDAITAILDGSEAVLNTRVLVLSASYEAPFEAIQASGNGFTIERKFYREVVEERVYDNKTGPNDRVAQWVPLQVGEQVKVGDKIRVEYAIWSAENRSFVKLTAGREASLRPVEQLSGYLGWGLLRPLRSGHSWTFTPNGYRNVKASATEFYFDSYPEENTVLAEEFFVTQAGRFVAPVTVIESLYAPHYRANSPYRPALVSE